MSVPTFFSNDNAVKLNWQSLNAVSIRFVPSVRRPIHWSYFSRDFMGPEFASATTGGVLVWIIQKNDLNLSIILRGTPSKSCRLHWVNA